MKYILFYKNDPKQEAISAINSSDLKSALKYFRSIKQLNLDSFNNIFGVKPSSNEK